MDPLRCTAIAPVNIATIKYWGKRDEELILPVNDSISATLNIDQLHAKTTVMASALFDSDQIWLNGKEESIDNKRLQTCFKRIKELAKAERKNIDALKWKLHICSENNFPTGAGLASSAAGYACLVFALSKLFDLNGDVTSIARQGSGSACRSLYGGFVRWFSGTHPDGSDSIAKQLKPASSWTELHVLILVVSDTKKKISSTSGMRCSVETSKLLKYRVDKCVAEHIAKMTLAIESKDFQLFSEITMKDSNQFHAICRDTFPPAVYMNDVSNLIVSFVHNYNSKFDHNKIAYTFDAGPNACLFVLEKDVPSVLSSVIQSFPPHSNSNQTQYITGIPCNISQFQNQVEGVSINDPGLLKYIIHTNIGEGPRVLSKEHDLLTNEGVPKSAI